MPPWFWRTVTRRLLAKYRRRHPADLLALILEASPSSSLTHEVATVILLTLNGISAERRIFFADFERRLVVRAVVPFV
jgi:hypothetical protein